MKLLLRIGALAMAFLPGAGLVRPGMVAAQTADPKPGAETKRLGYFVGKWSGEVEVKPTQFGPEGKFTESADSSWMPGGFFIVMHWLEKMPTGQGRTLMVLGYDATEKVYTFNTFQGTGEAATLTVVAEVAEAEGSSAVSPTTVAAIALCVAVTVVFGIWPAPLVDFAHKATLLFR